MADVLGDRAAGRFLLSDAQFVLAQEHGFRTWAGFRAHIQSRSASGDRPVSRLPGMSPGGYASMADVLLTDLRPQAEALLAGDTGRLARLTAGQADTLLHMLAYREAIPGARLDEELGVPRAAVDVLR